MKYFEFDKKYILRFPNIENKKNELQKQRIIEIINLITFLLIE